MTVALELTVLLAGAGPSIEGLLSRCTEPSLDVDGRAVKLKLVHVHSTGEEGSLCANSALPLHVDVVVVVKRGVGDDVKRRWGGVVVLGGHHFLRP